MLTWAFPSLPGTRGITGYLPLHSLIETIAIAISIMVFAVGWNAHSDRLPGNMVLLSCAFIGVGMLDLRTCCPMRDAGFRDAQRSGEGDRFSGWSNVCWPPLRCLLR